MMIGLAKLALGSENVGLTEVPDPEAGPGQAVVAVTAAGICGTDLHIVSDEYASKPPVIMGHEVTGTVLSVGSEKDSGWIGRRVVMETYFRTCEVCDMCRAGRRNLCSNRESIGSAFNGGFAPFVLVPVINLHEVPPTVSDTGAALAEPLACVVQCILVTRTFTAGQKVLVTGPGPMGFLSAQVARAGGADVLVSGLPADKARLEVLNSIGIRTTTDRPEPEAFDTVLECSGAGAAAAVGISALKRGGRYVGIGIFGRDVTIPLDQLLYKELTFTSGFASTPQSWNLALALMASGALYLDAAISDIVALHEWESAFDRLRSGNEMKILLSPSSQTTEAAEAQ